MLTLQESKVGLRDKIAAGVVDEFRRQSFLLESLIFDNTTSAGGSGSTLVYGYQKVDSISTSDFREINSEYVADVSKRKEYIAKLKIFGGDFTLDRVIIASSGPVNELSFQLVQKVSSAVNTFHMAVINGGTVKLPNGFDGLEKLLAGGPTDKTISLDLSSTAKLKDNADEFVDHLDEFLDLMHTKPTMLLVNSKMAIRIKSVARKLGYYTRSEDAFGRKISGYDGIPIIDLGDYYNGGNASGGKSIIGIEEDGTSPIYAITIEPEGFHGISLTGDKVVKTYLPDLSNETVLKTGSVEAVMGVVLKNSYKAGVLRGIKIVPTV